MANLQLEPSRILTGTWEEIVEHRNEIPDNATLEVRVFDRNHLLELPNRFAGKTAADVLAEIGTVKGLPHDLSTNPKYTEGFGESSDNSK